jgi:hypothetical protein
VGDLGGTGPEFFTARAKLLLGIVSENTKTRGVCHFYIKKKVYS